LTSISIVTPTLNAAGYLAECLASVHGQGVAGLQHVIVDGGSTDGTLEIARSFSHVAWLSLPGSKQAEAINVGLRGASGELVAWLNADDQYLPGALDFVAEQFSGDPALDVVYGDCEVIGADGQRLWWERPGPYNFRRMLRRGNYLAQPAVFLRRRVFEEIGYLDESLDYGMDYDLWLRLRGRRVKYAPRPLARFRWHPESKSARGQMRSWNEFLRIVRRHGGGWTPEIAWAYARCLVTLARTRLGQLLTGAAPVRPLTRGSA
jgi:glycosyltransferase involved in cell wall biosynthesis